MILVLCHKNGIQYVYLAVSIVAKIIKQCCKFISKNLAWACRTKLLPKKDCSGYLAQIVIKKKIVIGC